MGVESHLRRAAAGLLEAAIRIAPPDRRDWGLAMRGELRHVEGAWPAMRWGLGGASVLVKQALASLLVPGRRGVVPDGGLFARNASLRRAALATGALCGLAALLFFAAPPFRQAFQVAMRPWYLLRSARELESGFEAVARRAERRHDPEGLAFCAVRLQDSRRSAQLAEEAVRLDPNLLWVYAVVGMRHPELPEIGQWIPSLEQWDPPNVLFYLIAAESVERAHFHRGVWTPATREQDQAWETAMAAAFRSPRFDDYLDRVAELNRRAVPRYSFYDPYEVQDREGLELPYYAFENSERFAKALLRSAADLEARGDRKGASEKYWAVARYGQVMDSQAHTAIEHWMGTSLQSMAYQQLRASSENRGDRAQAALFGYLAAKFDPVTGEHPKMAGESVFGLEVSVRNAAVVEISALMMLIFFLLAATAASMLIVDSRRRARPVAQRAKPVATLVVLTSSVGLLFSTVTLYLTYRPYWYIFQGAIQSGGRSRTIDFRLFLMQAPLGLSPTGWLGALLYSGSPSFLFYFWTSLTLLGIIGIILILLRHWRGRAEASAL